MKTDFFNVFVLNVGRSGSTTFAKACTHISNFSSGHETKSWEIGMERLTYSVGHIEVDNKLSWMLGSLDVNYGHKAYYVHLTRNKEDVVNSWNQLWNHSFSNIRFFAEGVLSNIPELLSEKQKRTISEHHYDAVNANIEFFLKDKSNVITIQFEDVEKGFRQFWTEIGAEGDLESALAEFKVKHNASLRSEGVAQKDRVFKHEIREKIFNKRISEAPSRAERLKLKFRLALFRLTGLRSEDF
ncbi:MAG: hypothetical protein ACJAVL_000236 [Bacteroidia bacterium]|jgi:hypothetical protein